MTFKAILLHVIAKSMIGMPLGVGLHDIMYNIVATKLSL